MKGGLHSRFRCSWRLSGAGFTVVEVMIVLAVTGMLFLSAALLVGGRQNREEFNIGIQQIQSQVQAVINEVSSGYYPSSGDFTCERSGSSISFSSGSNEQGTNSDCIFLGKVIEFGSGVAGAGNAEKMAIHALAGLRTDSSGDEILDFQSTSPTVIPNSSTDQPLGSGLTTYSMTYNSGARPIAAVAIVSTLGQVTSTGTLAGSQHLNIIPIDGTALTDDQSVVIATINSFLKTGTLSTNPTGGVQVCFVSGGTNQSGLMTIGNSGTSGRDLDVTMDVKTGRTC